MTKTEQMLIGKGVKDVAEFWGGMMPMMCMEEAGELIQAISKYERQVLANEQRAYLVGKAKTLRSSGYSIEDIAKVFKKTDSEVRDMVGEDGSSGRYPWSEETEQNLIDEIGDMYISLAALRIHYGIDFEKVEQRVINKLNKKY